MIRSELREHIFKTLFQIEFNETEEMPDRLQYYLDTIGDAKEKDKEYIRQKYEAVVSHVQEIDALLNEAARGWKTSRMNKVDLTILRLAVYEMRWDEDVPGKVAINEAVELVKKYGADNDYQFVNGLLGTVAREREERPEATC